MDYIGITNYNRLGEMGISRNAIRSIAIYAVNNVKGAKVYFPTLKRLERKKKETEINLFTLPSGVKVALSKDGRAFIKIDVIVNFGSNAAEIAKNIQKEVAEAVAMMCESLSYEVSIKIVRVESIPS